MPLIVIVSPSTIRAVPEMSFIVNVTAIRLLIVIDGGSQPRSTIDSGQVFIANGGRKGC